jgi:o-succinylbenzoate synthase
MVTRFRGLTAREGMLIEGPQGWGEFCPFAEYDDREAGPWLYAAIEAGTVGWPDPVRGRVPINVTVPAVDPVRAQEITANSGCRTAKVKVADRPDSLVEDVARVEAVRAALGPNGPIRCDANGMWDVDTALPELDFACGLGTRSLLTSDLVAESRSLIPVDGYLPVAPMPPRPDPELVERYAITDN